MSDDRDGLGHLAAVRLDGTARRWPGPAGGKPTYRSVVVGTDGSATAAVAVRRAIEIARSSGAALHVVHAHTLAGVEKLAAAAEPNGYSVDIGQLNQELAAEGRQVCARAVEVAQRAGVAAEAHPCSGDAAGEIVATAERVDADLVVVGNRGMSGLRRFVLGSVPNKISHQCRCDVLIVDTRDTESRIRRATSGCCTAG
jgi:nucleotide-binding universal stress UspA family protein